MAQGSFGGRKVREGTVVSDKMDKTVVVAVETRVRHPLYKKIVRRLRRHLAHDETNDAKLGDVVRIVESRPFSRRKRWRMAEVLIRAERPEVLAQDVDLELLGEVKPEQEEEEAAVPVEAVAEEPAPEGEAEAPVEAAEEVPPVEEVVMEPQAAEAPEAAALEPEAEAEAKPAEAAAEEPEAKQEEPHEIAAEAPETEEAAEAAADEPQDEEMESEEKEGSS
jgi:small subunit ribosomal protein S17